MRKYYSIKNVMLLLLFILFTTGCAMSSALEPEINDDPHPSQTPDFMSDEHPDRPSHDQPIVRIVIDAGHGGKDPGATGVSGAYEKEFNLSVAARVYELLEQDPMFEPMLTRGGDEFITLQDRAKLANDWDADALISIHGNTFEDPSVHGTETYYYRHESKQLAQTIQDEVAAALNTRNRGIKEKSFVILKNTNMPSIIVEVGYLTNADEEKFILSENGQDLAAQAIYEGVKKYFNVERN